MIGLSKKDKEEIMEYPKTFGVILYGMHKDLGLMRKSVREYKEILNKYIRYSQSLNEKFEIEIGNVRNEHEKVKVDTVGIMNQLNNCIVTIDSNMKSMENLNYEFKKKYDDFKVRESLIEKAIKEGNRVMEQKITNMFTLFEASKNELQQSNLEVERIMKLAQHHISITQKQTLQNRIIIYILGFLLILSSIFHFV